MPSSCLTLRLFQLHLILGFTRLDFRMKGDILCKKGLNPNWLHVHNYPQQCFQSRNLHLHPVLRINRPSRNAHSPVRLDLKIDLFYHRCIRTSYLHADQNWILVQKMQFQTHFEYH